MKPLLVGLHNPLSTNPRSALYPVPTGCTGWRLWRMMALVEPGFSRLQYLEAFDRRNLWRAPDLPTGPGSTAAYRAEGRIVRDACHCRDDVVLLGRRVWDAVVALEAPAFFAHKSDGRTRFHYLPHPSGRNLLYNVTARQRRAGKLLLSLIE